MLQRLLLLVSLVLAVCTNAQVKSITLSGLLKSKTTKQAIAFATIQLKLEKDSSFVAGTISNEEGRFSLTNLASGNYILEATLVGYKLHKQVVLIGRLSSFLDLATIELEEDAQQLTDVLVTAKQETVAEKMDKKTFSIADNITQSGGSVLQAMKNLPGITVDGNGKLQLRGSNRVTILVDGKQTAMTGFGNQAALDNIPASAIERIEIINNPSSKYDANGNAGIINIIYKKTKQDGFNGKLSVTTGLGALWEKKENLPTIRPQYQATPKINPSLSLNYRKNKVNLFLQADYMYNKTLNRNEFADRYYTNGDTIRQQVKRNRLTTVGAGKMGVDWNINSNNSITVSGLFSSEHVTDHGDIPYFNDKLSERKRLWQFFEDEVNTAATATVLYQHKFKQAGHLLNLSYNYTFHREDEKYFLINQMPAYTGKDTFMLLADEHVTDITVDYTKPLKSGKLETGAKFRWRNIPTNMRFFPGINSPLDVNAGGWARYNEVIPALYSNYIYEAKKMELEAGVRLENVNLKYTVNPDHNTYKSDGYEYVQLFPSVRLTYIMSENNRLSVFYNRRVDRPDEGDIRIFPKYDEPEILKVGNPALRPQFTQSIELGYKSSWAKGYFYSAAYHRISTGTITRIGTTVPGSNIIYNVFQNAKKATNTGVELIANQKLNNFFSFNINVNAYQNIIDAFTVENKYPVPAVYSAQKEKAYSGSVKLNTLFSLKANTEIQVAAIYLAPDIIPQGKIAERFSIDLGIKKSIQKSKGELFFNATDLFNTLRISKDISGTSFRIISTDYYETQVYRLGYSYKF